MDATLLLQAYTNTKFLPVLHGQVPGPLSGDEAHRRANTQESWVLGQRRFSSLVRGDEGRSCYDGSQRRNSGNHSESENVEITEGCMWMAQRAEEVENSTRSMQTPRPPKTPPPPSQDLWTFTLDGQPPAPTALQRARDLTFRPEAECGTSSARRATAALEESLEGVDEEIRRIGERNRAEQPERERERERERDILHMHFVPWDLPVVDYNSTSTYTRNAETLPTNPRHKF
jgi:hypothetical protein